jgi:hypothetical protein
LGERVLEGSGWNVWSEPVAQTLEEALVELNFPQDMSKYAIYKIDDSKVTTEGLKITKLSDTALFKGKKVYAFYSSCNSKPDRFQFIYSDSGYSKNSGRVITNTECQYYIENVTSWTTISNLGISYPEGMALANNTGVSQDYRGNRYNFSTKQFLHPGLNAYVTKYKYYTDS